jgi:hypothetical protein
MKTSQWFLSACFIAGLALAGCTKESSAKVDTTQFEASFKTAEPDTRTASEKVVSNIKNADYSGSLADLKTLASKAKLTPEQQQSVKDTVSQVEKAISDGAAKVLNDANKGLKKVADGAKNAIEDSKRSLSK